MTKYLKGSLHPFLAQINSSNPSDLFDYTMTNLMDNFYSKIMANKSGEGAFRAVCLSGVQSSNNTGAGIHYLDMEIQNGDAYVIVRPLTSFGLSIPDPRNFKDIGDIEDVISMHANTFLAKSSYKHDSQSPINFGQVIICRFEEGSVANSSFEGLVFDEPTMVIYDETFRNLNTLSRLESAADLYSSSSPVPLYPIIPGLANLQPNPSESVPPMLANSGTEVEQLARAYDTEPQVPNKGRNDPRIAMAHPIFQDHIKAFIYKCWRTKSISISLNSTYRNRTAQDKLISEWEAGTRTIEPARWSYHLAGLAFDFNPRMPSGKVITSKASKSTWISSEVPSIGQSLNLYWGGNFSSNYDPIHFDMRNLVSKTLKNKIIKKGNANKTEATAVKVNLSNGAVS